MTADRPLRILHLPVDLGGHARALAWSQRKLGADAISANLHPSPYGFEGDLSYARSLGDPFRIPMREWGRMRLMARSMLADVIHLHFGQSLASLRPFPLKDRAQDGLAGRLWARLARTLWLSDIALWRRMGKTVAMTFYGDDIRLVSEAIQRNPWTHLSVSAVAGLMVDRDPLKHKLCAALGRLGIIVFATNPDLLATLPQGSTFLPYGHVYASPSPTPPAFNGDVLRLLHLPTNRAVKGTDFFIAAVEQAKSEGARLELTIAEGIPNRDVPALIRANDLLLDQLRVGWYGGVAVEAMAEARPALAWLNPADIALLPSAFRRDIPVVSASASSAAGRLVTLWREGPEAFAARALASHAFTKCWHDPDQIARQVLSAYQRGQLGSVSTTTRQCH